MKEKYAECKESTKEDLLLKQRRASTWWSTMLRHKGDCGFYLSRLSSDSVRFWGCLEAQWACYGRSRALLQMCLKINWQVSTLIGGGDQDSEQCSKQKLRWRSECHTYLQALFKENRQTGNSLKTFRRRSRRASNKSVDKWLLSRYKITPYQVSFLCKDRDPCNQTCKHLGTICGRKAVASLQHFYPRDKVYF